MLALIDVEAGSYDPSRQSKTLKAVLQALAFSQKNERMPSHGELKELGFNDHQATDAGKWLAMQNNTLPDPLFLPLHQIMPPHANGNDPTVWKTVEILSQRVAACNQKNCNNHV